MFARFDSVRKLNLQEGAILSIYFLQIVLIDSSDDYRAVDVSEYIVFHLRAGHCRDDCAILNRNQKRFIFKQDQGFLRSFFCSFSDTGPDSIDFILRERDIPIDQPADRMSGKFHIGRGNPVLQHFGKTGTLVTAIRGAARFGSERFRRLQLP